MMLLSSKSLSLQYTFPSKPTVPPVSKHFAWSHNHEQVSCQEASVQETETQAGRQRQRHRERESSETVGQTSRCTPMRPAPHTPVAGVVDKRSNEEMEGYHLVHLTCGRVHITPFLKAVTLVTARAVHLGGPCAAGERQVLVVLSALPTRSVPGRPHDGKLLSCLGDEGRTWLNARALRRARVHPLEMREEQAHAQNGTKQCPHPHAPHLCQH
mmetsp:Transcript_24946/g.59958  ORF Transcript_24946/g.59958 Transcript_24946/m.59958 type:complete len:213 (-) Transcript_24946:112-750(-)